MPVTLTVDREKKQFQTAYLRLSKDKDAPDSLANTAFEAFISSWTFSDFLDPVSLQEIVRQIDLRELELDLNSNVAENLLADLDVAKAIEESVEVEVGEMGKLSMKLLLDEKYYNTVINKLRRDLPHLKLSEDVAYQLLHGMWEGEIADAIENAVENEIGRPRIAINTQGRLLN